MSAGVRVCNHKRETEKEERARIITNSKQLPVSSASISTFEI